MTVAPHEATSEAVFAQVLDIWKHGIDVHDTAEIGSAFAEDALFQGGKPEPSRGRASVVAYYDPDPLTGVEYEIIDARRPADDVIVGYAAAHFAFPGDAPTVHRHVTMVLERSGDDWLIGHYHVSLIPVAH
ncbi:nuclear transport factor 2 family protein [Streptomyces parvulus]|uniref:YybH family protein n=1 Tax=Streptomyces parvulus TaxID=146923 RepID=UPI001CFAFD63|nr:nuclear transport factor 2 family protein [Streptomyces parvulus]